MIGWAAIVGALLGGFSGGYNLTGVFIGGVLGALMGLWLRSLVQQEIQSAVQAALAEAQPVAPQKQAAHPLESPAPVEEEVETVPAPVADAPPHKDAPTPAPDAHRQPDPARWAAPRHVETYHPARTDPVEEAIAKARAWLLGGNTIVRAGLAVLFVGLVFLARFAANAGLFPIEMRLTLIALIGAALLLVGLNKRIERPSFGLSLQGAGVAVLYLVVFAAAKAYGVLPPAAAFAFMILFAALGCGLALMQDSLTMALASFLGGFAVPVLLGGKSETPLGLFTYLTILNVAILVIAWKKSWRPLNLLGFVATFLLAGLWGFSAYETRHFLLCEIFLIASIAIYLATAMLYAHNTPGPLGNYADSTLLFGTALAGFGLQAGLVHGRPFAEAFSALGFGASYLGMAALTLRRRRAEMRLLNECLLAIGVGFVTLAVPLALEAKWTAATWALEGAGAFWVGARQARWMPRAFGLLLQTAAALMVAVSLEPNIAALPLANNGFMVPMLVALPVLFTAWLLRAPLAHSGSSLAQAYAPWEYSLRKAWFLGGFALVCLAILRETDRYLPAPAAAPSLSAAALSPYMQLYTAMLAILGAMALAQAFGRSKDWPVAGWPARLSLPLLTLCLLAALMDGRNILYLPDLFYWALAIGLHLWLLRHLPVDRWTLAMHGGGVLLGTAMVADGLWLGIDRGALWDTSWAGVVFLISATAMLFALTRWAGKAASRADMTGLGWPLDPAARAYWWHGARVLAVLVYGGALATTLMAEGVTDPLPYVPLLNPVDLTALLALATLGLWRQMLCGAQPRPDGAGWIVSETGMGAGAVLDFAIVNTLWLRTAHHYLGVGWSSEELIESQIVQSGCSLLWTLVAMGLMLFAHRRRQRLPWLTGAVLLGVVVVKLVIVDMSKVEGVARIVAFIGVGLLMLLIGYFVPLPPRADDRAGLDA
ncbi:MAG: hypothetical protein ABT10_07210 [Novosphingobium sp. SCN 63-17]|nr:MAG: hypothetical protein ABT10_07210 [Novosphingobium sp. SCN 63-17]OJX96780.1 MAG: hypothetical protein BGP00_17415 [Novosphingobium sp. 63-713]